MPDVMPTTHAGALIRAWTDRIALEADDPAGIHARRVGLRRLRVACDLLAPVLPGLGLKRCGRRLRDLSEALAPVRAADVALARLARLREEAEDSLEQAALEHLQAWMTLSRRRALKKSLDPLEPKVFKSLRKDLARLAEALDDPAAPTNSPAAAWSLLEPAFHAAYGPLAALATKEDGAELHEVRLQMKRFRYALELLEPLFQEGFAELMARTRGLQDALGDHHDLTLLDLWISGRREALMEAGHTTLGGGVEPLMARVDFHRRQAYQCFRDRIPGTSVDLLGKALWFYLAPIQEAAPAEAPSASPQEGEAAIPDANTGDHPPSPEA